MWKILFIVLLTNGVLISQNNWNYLPSISYPNTQITDFLVDNNNLIVYGDAFNNNTEWKQGLIISKLDSNGTILKEVLLLDSLGDKLAVSEKWGKISKTLDEGYIATAAPVQRNSFILIKLSSDLEISFIKEYTDTTLISNFWYIPLEVEGGYLLYGVVQHPDLKVVGVVKYVNHSGDILWDKQYSFTAFDSYITDLRPYSDSTFIMITSESVNPSSNPWLNEYRYGIHILDYQGNIIKQYHSPSLGFIRNVIPIENGDFITYGLERKDIYFNTELLQSELTRFDSNFNIKWSFNFGNIRSIGAKQLQRFGRTVDGHFVGVGQFSAKNASDPSRGHGWIYKFSAEGDSIWGRSFPTPLLPDEYPNGGVLYGVGALSSGNIVAGGTAEDDNNRYCWIVKVTNDGCMDTLFCQTSSVGSPFEETDDVNIYPNPTTSHFIIDSRFAIHKVMLFDSYNHIIYETNVDASQKSISLPSNIASGLYFVQICTKKGSIISKKLMVNK